jgi:hypothetical protein
MKTVMAAAVAILALAGTARADRGHINGWMTTDDGTKLAVVFNVTGSEDSGLTGRGTIVDPAGNVYHVDCKGSKDPAEAGGLIRLTCTVTNSTDGTGEGDVFEIEADPATGTIHATLPDASGADGSGNVSYKYSK